MACPCFLDDQYVREGATTVNNEIHHGEVVEEKGSLSDRFGLWVSFYVFKQELYLEIVQKTIARLCVENKVEPQWNDELSRAAIKWSHKKNKRCGRTALQFTRHRLGQYMMVKES